VLALLLTAVGLYGIMTYAVNRRTGELGLRIALGAEPGTVLRMVLGDALRIVGAGVGIGLGLGVVSLRLLGSQLHGIGTADPASIAVALAVLSTAALLAAFFPARRAGRVSPLVALQQE
jgi:ABC-type antimicrobial peptide transport system permease subunit